MVIKLLRNTVADGQLVGAGQVLNATDPTARTLVQMGKAVLWTEPIEPQKPIEPVVAEPVSAPVIADEPIADVKSVADEPIAPPPPARHGKSGKGKGGK